MLLELAVLLKSRQVAQAKAWEAAHPVELTVTR